MFRYYSLRGDTAMPGELYARLCHAFLLLSLLCALLTVGGRTLSNAAIP